MFSVCYEFANQSTINAINKFNNAWKIMINNITIKEYNNSRCGMKFSHRSNEWRDDYTGKRNYTKSKRRDKSNIIKKRRHG